MSTRFMFWRREKPFLTRAQQELEDVDEFTLGLIGKSLMPVQSASGEVQLSVELPTEARRALALSIQYNKQANRSFREVTSIEELIEHLEGIDDAATESLRVAGMKAEFFRSMFWSMLYEYVVHATGSLPGNLGVRKEYAVVRLAEATTSLSNASIPTAKPNAADLSDEDRAFFEKKQQHFDPKNPWGSGT